MFVVLPFSTTSSLLLPTSQSDEVSTFNPEWVRFEVREDVYHDAKGIMDDTLTPTSCIGGEDAHRCVGIISIYLTGRRPMICLSPDLTC